MGGEGQDPGSPEAEDTPLSAGSDGAGEGLEPPGADPDEPAASSAATPAVPEHDLEVDDDDALAAAEAALSAVSAQVADAAEAVVDAAARADEAASDGPLEVPAGSTDAVGHAPAVDASGRAEADTTPAEVASASPEHEAAAAPVPAPRTLAHESHGLLRADVRTPVGIPKAYQPTEASVHELLHVELKDFVGPLDLLLFLIREHDLDVLDIPIAFITERYLELLDTLQGLPIDVASEFLVMAAELTHIKSKMLLPPEEGVPVEMEEGEAPGDPRADLVRRLLEYQKYRDAARTLESGAQLGRDVFTRGQVVLEAMEDLEPGPGDFSIFRLVEAMADVLSRLTPEKQHEVIADTVTITERIELILAFGEARGPRFPFIDLFAGMESRRVVVMTFLAILEMARTGMLRIEQDPPTELPAEEARAQAADAEAPGTPGDEGPSVARAPEPAPPVEAAPGETAPVEVVPGEAAPVDTAPVEAAPGDAASVEAVPGEAAAQGEGTEGEAGVVQGEAVEAVEAPHEPSRGAGLPGDALAASPLATETSPAAGRQHISADDLDDAYRAAELSLEEGRVRVVRAVSELPPLVVPRPAMVMLVLTGRRGVSGDGVRDDYSG